MTIDRTNRLPATAAEPTRSGWPADVPRPQPPVWQVFDVAVDIGPGGEALAHLGIGPGLRAGAGLAGAGLVAMLADCILGTDAALRARARIATAVLTVDVVGSPPESGSLSAVSGPSCRRAGYLLTTADVHDEAGTDVARVSGWFALRAGSPVPSAPAAPLPARPLRRADVPSVPSGRTASPAGGDLTATPLGRTLGLASFARAADGSVAFELPQVGRLCNSGGTLHGGVAALMASMAALATLGDSVRPDVLSMTCHYLRGADADGGPVRVTGRQIRRGRTSAVVQGDVYAADGRPAMHTVVTTALTPRPLDT